MIGVIVLRVMGQDEIGREAADLGFQERGEFGVG